MSTTTIDLLLEWLNCVLPSTFVSTKCRLGNDDCINILMPDSSPLQTTTILLIRSSETDLFKLLFDVTVVGKNGNTKDLENIYLSDIHNLMIMAEIQGPFCLKI